MEKMRKGSDTCMKKRGVTNNLRGEGNAMAPNSILDKLMFLPFVWVVDAWQWLMLNWMCNKDAQKKMGANMLKWHFYSVMVHVQSVSIYKCMSLHSMKCKILDVKHKIITCVGCNVYFGH